MGKQKDTAKKSILRLCAALCVCLLCAGFVHPAPGHAAGPGPTPVMITRRPSVSVTPSPTPSPTEAPPVLVQVHYVTEKGSVLASAGYPLKESGTVEADPDVVPEGYELAGETACYVQIENGTASPDPVRFLIRKKPTPSPVPTQTTMPVPTGTPTPAPTETPVPEVFVPVYYVTENGSVLLRTECRLTASGTVRADPEMVPEGFELSGETVVEVRLENGIAEPSSVEFTVRRKATPLPSASTMPTPTSVTSSAAFTFQKNVTPTPGTVPDVSDEQTEAAPIESDSRAAEAGQPAGRKKTDLSDFRTVGNIVRFGHYEQDNDTANGPEEIEWIVLDVQGNKALLLSRYGLDAQPYHIKNMSVSWEECTLRSWLNGEFLQAAFNGEEQKAIQTTSVDNSEIVKKEEFTYHLFSTDLDGWKYEREWGTDSTIKNTEDKLFLLNHAEASRYVGLKDKDKENTKPRAAPTAYAVGNGALMSRSHLTAEGSGAGRWWLRSPEYRSYVVETWGILYPRDSTLIGCVRPALWIDLESDFF